MMPFLGKTAAAVLISITFFLPVSIKASEQAHGIWGVGVQIGMAEYGSFLDQDPGFLLRSLNYARDLAAASGCIPTDEIDSLIAAMRMTSSSRSLYNRIYDYRIRLARYVMENCNCTGLAASDPNPPPPVTGEVWETSEGKWYPEFDGDRVFGRYSQDGGRILGRLSGTVMTGYWVENASGNRCTSPIDGSYYWGTVEFVFNDRFTEFTGRWSHCDQPLGRSWNGRRLEP